MFHETPLTFPVNPFWPKNRIILLSKTLDVLHTELIPFFTEISIPKKLGNFCIYFFMSYITCVGLMIVQKAETCRFIKHLRT
jgi:hypothetical protein